MNSNLIKIISYTATAIGIGASFLTNWVDDKKMDKKIEEKVIEMFTKRN